MYIERDELVEMLRCRGNDQTAARAQLSLPQHVDLRRDRAVLRQCGIDPNVLAFVLSRRQRTTGMPEPPPQPAVDADEADDVSAKVDGRPRTSRVRQGPRRLGSRTVPGATTNVSRLSLPSLPSSDQRADQTAARSTSVGKSGAGFSVTTKSAIRCPRCHFAFGSSDLMLDHLSAHHLNAGRLTSSSGLDGVPNRNAGADHPTGTQPSAAVLADLEDAFRRSSKSPAQRRLVTCVILGYLLIVALVVILV